MGVGVGVGETLSSRLCFVPYAFCSDGVWGRGQLSLGTGRGRGPLETAAPESRALAHPRGIPASSSTSTPEGLPAQQATDILGEDPKRLHWPCFVWAYSMNPVPRVGTMEMACTHLLRLIP